MTTAKIIPLPRQSRLECSDCGASVKAACDCHAPYVPAGTRATKAVEENPEMSDRAIAADIGVSHTTVQKARKSTGNKLPVARTGRDGKRRRVPRTQSPDAFCEVNPRVAAFLKELDFFPGFTRRLEEWFDSGPALDADARYFLVHSLTMLSIEIGRIAQKIDGR